MISFFDATCRIGRRGILHPGSFYRSEDLLARMQQCGIDEALVYHSLAREYDPAVGNEKLYEEIAGEPRFHPVCVAMPHRTGEFPSPEAMIAKMKLHGVQAVRMFPAANEHNYGIDERSCSELFAVLEQYRIPLFIGLDQLNWDGLHDLGSRHPQLRVVVTDVNYRVNRRLYPLFDRHSEFFLETYGYKAHLGIEEFCGQFGADRLIFGSGMPLYSGAAAVSHIRYAMIGDEDKRKIAGDNLRKLLGEVRL